MQKYKTFLEKESECVKWIRTRGCSHLEATCTYFRQPKHVICMQSAGALLCIGCMHARILLTDSCISPGAAPWWWKGEGREPASDSVWIKFMCLLSIHFTTQSFTLKNKIKTNRKRRYLFWPKEHFIKGSRKLSIR